MRRRIDSHQHFWQLDRGDYAWLRADVPALAPIHRDFLPMHLEASLQAHQVSQTILVQAADSLRETGFMLALAGRHSMIGGVVGWVDISDRSAVATLEGWACHPQFKGVRPMLQDLPDAAWIAHAPHADVVRALVRLGLRFDALVKPAHLASLLRFVQAHPDLPIVIDHAAKPPLAQGWHSDGMALWREQLPRIAACPNVMCKLSGLLTEAGPKACASVAAGVDALQPVWAELLHWFGPERLMWGSDWPVLTLATEYADWVRVSDTLIGELTTGQQAWVRHDNAVRFYGLEAGVPAPGAA